MAREEFAGCDIAGGGGELRIDPRVLDVLVAYPILHERDVGLGIEEVGADRMLEAVELVLLRRETGRFCIVVHEIPEGRAVEGKGAIRDEEIWGLICARAKIGAEEFDDVGLQGIDA